MLTKPKDFNKSPKCVAMPACGIVVFEARHGPGFFGELKDDYSKFCLLIAGRAHWESGGHRYDVAANTLFHIAAQVPHRQRDLLGQPVTLYTIHYRPELLRPELTRELEAAGTLPLDLQGAGRDEARQILGVVQEMMFEQETQRLGWEALLIARLTVLAVLLLRRTCGGAIRIDRLDESGTRVALYAARLKTEFYTAVSIDDAARSVGLGRRRFTELFREITGESWRRHIHRLRMDYAEKLLASTERSVTSIAFECGFEELSHFHHSFKATYGTTPVAFRQRFRPISQSVSPAQMSALASRSVA